MKTVLVVDDNADIRELAAAVLRADGYDVREAVNGQDALDLLADLREEPCLVLLDLMMPVMDGRTFLDRLGEQHRAAPIPVVVVSAAVTGSVAGAKRVARKPVSPDVLRMIVRDLCGPSDEV